MSRQAGVRETEKFTVAKKMNWQRNPPPHQKYQFRESQSTAESTRGSDNALI